MKQIQYIFVGKGSIVSKNSDNEHLKPKSNRIFLDVGNSLDFDNGIIDNHQIYSTKNGNTEEFKSIAKYCYENEDKIKEYIKNITEQEVEIIVHTEPDIDCFVSAYILEKYLNDQKLPSYTAILIKCVEEIDSGKAKFKNVKPINPCFITYAISEVIKEDMKKSNEENKFNINEQSMKKGLQLIELILNELNEQKSLDNIDLSTKSDIFNRELELLSNDYNTYLRECHTPEICEKGKMKLLLKGSFENKLKEVDALFWLKAPKCILHKYWARQDSEAPLNEGYIFTFIPQELNIDPSSIVNNTNNNSDKMLFNGIKTNKVIISVNPSSDVCLQGLGESLEIAEREIEKKYFGENINNWRSRNKSRFPEKWCDNEDPWYDGRNSDYTIIDAPRVGSLMSIKEIKHIVNNYTIPFVDGHLIRIVIPFDFNEGKYKNLCNDIRNNKNVSVINYNTETNQSTTKDEEKNKVYIKNYFNSYIQTYLFEDLSKKTIGDNCSEYFINHKIESIVNIRKDSKVKIKTDISISNSEVNFIIFKYGVGFIHFDINILKNDGDLYFDEILSIDNIINSNSGNKVILEEVFNKLDINNGYDIKEKKLMIYSRISIKSNMLYEGKHKEMIYKLMNFMSWEDDNQNARYIKHLVDNDIIRNDKNTYYGFNKYGGAMIIIDDHYECIDSESCKDCNLSGLSFKQKCLDKEINKSINNDFAEIDFYVFILALQQRLSLLDFYNKLSIYDKKRNKKDIQRLRSLLLNFTTQGWFTEITEDKIGTEFYRKWTSIFQNTELYKDIYEQLSNVDDYYKSKMSSKFTLISALTFPIVISASIASIFSTGYMKNSGDVFGLAWVSSNETAVGALSIGWFWFALFCLSIVIIFGISFLKDE